MQTKVFTIRKQHHVVFCTKRIITKRGDLITEIIFTPLNAVIIIHVWNYIYNSQCAEFHSSDPASLVGAGDFLASRGLVGSDFSSS